MHESDLAQEVVDAVLARCATAQVRRVRVVRGWIAETEALSSESLSSHFAAHARGTAAEGAVLALRLIHVPARCRACQTLYAPQHHLLLCPHCGSTDGEVQGQTGLGLESLDVE